MISAQAGIQSRLSSQERTSQVKLASLGSGPRRNDARVATSVMGVVPKN